MQCANWRGNLTLPANKALLIKDWRGIPFPLRLAFNRKRAFDQPNQLRTFVETGPPLRGAAR